MKLPLFQTKQIREIWIDI